jgi:hypothetical protein
MKKGLVLLGAVLLLSGCGKEKVTCTYKDDTQTYKNKREVLVTFEKDKVFSFKSTITEEHTEEETANNSYIAYQELYNNYNENNVISEFKKDKLKITAIYNIDLRDIETKKIEFEFDFTASKDNFLKELKDKGFSCK